MRNSYRRLEEGFEKLVSIAIAVLGNSITFIVALGLVIYWLSNLLFYTQELYYSIRDVVFGVTFLSLFIIQKSFNRFSASIHVKINELLASHDPARNALLNVEKKSEHEITELSKEYTGLAEQGESAEDENRRERKEDV